MTKNKSNKGKSPAMKKQTATKSKGTTMKAGGAATDSPKQSNSGAKRAKASKREAKPKRIGALDAAAQVLARASKPMRARDLIVAMAEQNLWTSPGGKTPHATLYAAMIREERDKGGDSRFKKVDRGMFEFAVK